MGDKAAEGIKGDQADSGDRLWQTLNAIMYQRNFLYSMFEIRRVEERRAGLGHAIGASSDIAFEALSNLDVMKNQLM